MALSGAAVVGRWLAFASMASEPKAPWGAPDPGLPPPPTRSVAPPPGFGQQTLIQPAGGGRPWWRRWWVLLVLGLLIAAGVVAAMGGEDEAGEADEPSPTVATDEPEPAPDDGSVAGPATTVLVVDEAVPDDEGTAPPDEPDDDGGDDPAPDVPAAGSIDLPFALGEAAVITVDGFGDADGSVWTVTVDEPGSIITDEVLAHNEFNDPPREGHDFFGVAVTLGLHAAGKEPLSTFINISPEFFLPVSRRVVSDGLDDGCGVVPGEFEPFKEVFVGGSISGMLCYSVPTEEADAGVLLTIDEIEEGRVFLASEPGVGVPSEDLPPDPPPAPAPGSGPAGSRSNPIPIGEPTAITFDTFGDADGSGWTLLVTGPGGDITDEVVAHNPFNDPPPDGHVFYGVPVSLTLESADKEPLSLLANTQLEFYAPVSLEIVGAALIEGCGVVPEAFDLFEEVFVGGTIAGTVCFTVPADDVAAGVLLTLDEIEQGRLFLATQPPG